LLDGIVEESGLAGMHDPAFGSDCDLAASGSVEGEDEGGFGGAAAVVAQDDALGVDFGFGDEVFGVPGVADVHGAADVAHGASETFGFADAEGLADLGIGGGG
jgi:hypothetical protein